MRDSTTQPEPGGKSATAETDSNASQQKDDAPAQSVQETGEDKETATRPGANELREAGETLGNP